MNKNLQIREFSLLKVLSTLSKVEKLPTNSDVTQLYIVRHGQTNWNREQRIQGHQDIPLNETGRKDAALVAEKMKETRLDLCFSSDLSRAYETAQIISSGRSLSIKTDYRLRERTFSNWEGSLFRELYNTAKSERMGVESDHVMNDRIFACLQDIVKEYSGQAILIATHGGVICRILSTLLELEDCEGLSIKNGAMLHLQHSREGCLIRNLEGIKLPETIPSPT